MNGGDSNPAVAEVQGLYGPFSFSEKLLQRIWQRGDFEQAGLVTTDGRAVVIDARGQWNGLAGPDFLRAKIRIGSEVRVGDVELHLYAEDWARHRHAQDPAYNNVVLHVVLFPPDAAHRTNGSNGAVIPVVSLLTLLRHDLEEYAAEEAVELLSTRGEDRLREALRQCGIEERVRRLRVGARQRWGHKVYFAQKRIERLGFDAACHQSALEVLGYRFNRVPMLNLAARYPLAGWRDLTEVALERMVIEEGANWARGGVRPANHPRLRLRQYAQWCRAKPDWPEVLQNVGMTWPQPSMLESTREVRKTAGLSGHKRLVQSAVCGGALGGARFDTLMGDAFFPLVAAKLDRDLAGLWWHWWAGDLPGFVESARQEVGGLMTPFCQGAAQGLIAWCVEIDRSST